jgi:hypothetical protein
MRLEVGLFFKKRPTEQMFQPPAHGFVGNLALAPMADGPRARRRLLAWSRGSVGWEHKGCVK